MRVGAEPLPVFPSPSDRGESSSGSPPATLREVIATGSLPAPEQEDRKTSRALGLLESELAEWIPVPRRWHVPGEQQSCFVW